MFSLNRAIRPIYLMGAFAIFLGACAAPGLAISEDAEEPLDLVPTESEPTLEPGETPEDEVQPEIINEEEAREDPFEGVRLHFSPRYWPDTDFSKHSVDLGEFYSGGPPPDGIPAIDNPVFESVEAADEWLGDDWPVMLFSIGEDVRIYPLAVLIYHEIVNDVVAGEPVSLTFCPLCNATVAFSRTLEDGTVLDFGTSGNLRNSDLVMYDRQTQSWWQQFTGEALVGELTGTQLEFLPSQIVGWSDVKAAHPEAQVLSRETGHRRSYGSNPYAGYDSISGSPWFPVEGEDDRLRPMERVAAIEIAGIDVAYPFSALNEVQVVNDEVGGQPLVVFWTDKTVSPLGDGGPEVGSTGVFSRELDGQVLEFKAIGAGLFEDLDTGSQWNIFGQAIAGPLLGESLEKFVSAEHFWFAWAAFRPDTVVWQVDG